MIHRTFRHSLMSLCLLLTSGCFSQEKPEWLLAYEDDGTGLIDEGDVADGHDEDIDVSVTDTPSPQPDTEDTTVPDADSPTVDADVSDSIDGDIEASDTGQSDIEAPDDTASPCTEDQVMGCDGQTCFALTRLGDGVCDEEVRCAALNYDDDDCAAQCGEAGAELAEALDAYWDFETLSEGQLNAYYRKMFIVSVQKAEECAAATDQSMSAIEACLGVTLPALGAGGVHNPLYGFAVGDGACTSCWARLGVDFFQGCQDVLDACREKDSVSQGVCESCRVTASSGYDDTQKIAEAFSACSGLPVDALAPCVVESCPGICGDGQCDAERGESFETCSPDCLCGDGVCGEEETFESCALDCCPGACGDKVCGWNPQAGCDAACGSCGADEQCLYGGVCDDNLSEDNPCLSTVSALKLNFGAIDGSGDMTFKQYLYAVWSEALQLVNAGCTLASSDTRPDCAATVLFDPNVESVTPWSYAPAYMGLMESSDDSAPACISCLGRFADCVTFGECAEACQGFASGAEPEPSEACTQCMVVQDTSQACRDAAVCAGFALPKGCETACGDSCDIPDGCAGVCTCGQGEECLGSLCVPICGDGACVDGEDLEVCPLDCGPASPCCTSIDGEACSDSACVTNVCELESTCCLDNDEAATSWSDGVCLEVAQQACQWLCQPETCGDGLCDCDAQENGTTCPADCADRQVTINVDTVCIDTPSNAAAGASSGEFTELQLVDAFSGQVLDSVNGSSPFSALTVSLERCQTLSFFLRAKDGIKEVYFDEELIDDAQAKIAFQHPDQSVHHCAPQTDNASFAFRQINPAAGDLELSLYFGRCASCADTRQVQFDVELPCDLQANDMTSAVNGVRVVGNWAPAASWDFINGLVLGPSWTDPSHFVGDFPIPIGTHEYLYSLDVGGVVANEDLKEEAQSGVCPTEDFIWSQPDAFDPYANRTLDALPDQMGSTQFVSDIAEQCTSECVVQDVCGDDACTGGEDQATCPEDCGAAQPSTGFDLNWSPSPAMSDDVSCNAANAGTSATCPLLFNASTVGMTSSLMTIEAQCAAGAVTDPPHVDVTGSVTVESGVSWTLQLEEVTAPASLGSGPAYGTGIELGMASGAESYNFNGLVMPHVPAEVLQLKATLNQTLAPSDPNSAASEIAAQTLWVRSDYCAPRVSWPSGYTEGLSFLAEVDDADVPQIQVEVDLAGFRDATITVSCDGGWGNVGEMTLSNTKSQTEALEQSVIRYAVQIPLTQLPPSALTGGASLTCQLGVVARDGAYNMTSQELGITIPSLDCTPNCLVDDGIRTCEMADGCGGQCWSCPRDCAEVKHRLDGAMPPALYLLDNLEPSAMDTPYPALCTSRAGMGLTLAAVFADDGQASWVWKNKEDRWGAEPLETSENVSKSPSQELLDLNVLASDYKNADAWNQLQADILYFIFRPLDTPVGQLGLSYDVSQLSDGAGTTLTDLLTSTAPSGADTLDSVTGCEPLSLPLIDAFKQGQSGYDVSSLDVVDSSDPSALGQCGAAASLGPALCDTNLYIHATDSNGQCADCGADVLFPKHSYGFTWHVRGPNGCDFDGPGRYGSFGANSAQPLQEACNPTSAACSPPLGFGYALGMTSSDSSSSTASGSTNDNVRLHISRAVCGNGVIEPGEGCDDGNHVDGDACSHDCVVYAQCERNTTTDSDYPGWVYSLGDRYYVFCDQGVAWSFAAGEFDNDGPACERVDGHLVKIEDLSENAWLTRRAAENPELQAFWTGLNRYDMGWSADAGQGMLYWHDMEPLFSGEDLSALELKDPEDTGWSSFDFLNINAVFVNSEPTASNYGLWGITTAGGVEHGYVCEVSGP